MLAGLDTGRVWGDEGSRATGHLEVILPGKP
eukprot:COSAG01_NODE_15603_length_1327_cov_1.428337_1_plen_30_part_10